ncbi:prealbumin-like fold domain-containing protein [Vibrio sp. FJH11]
MKSYTKLSDAAASPRTLVSGTLVAAALTAFSLSFPAFGFIEPPNTVNLTHEGCRNNGDIILPNGDGNFICPDAAYTTGNLGKGWNELDLVPHRITLRNGNSNGNITYNLRAAANNIDQDKLGYDAISPADDIVVIGDCTVSTAFNDPLQPWDITNENLNGADQSLFQEFEITQGPNTSCEINFYYRLAVGSNEYPGSSLQSYLADQSVFQGGLRTISLPVKEILPQDISKDMDARQDTDFTWNLTKESNKASINLGDTCDVENPASEDVAITLKWQLLDGVSGKVTVKTNITLTNPASRPIDVDVTDIIKGNLGGGLIVLDTKNFDTVTVPANTMLPLTVHMYIAESDVTELMDIATATYTDQATGIPVPGETVAKFDLTTDGMGIQPGASTNTTAVVTDEEYITGNYLQYSADSTAVGSAAGNFTYGGLEYTLGTLLNKLLPNLLWTSGTQPEAPATCTIAGECFVTINKTVSVTQRPIVTSGILSDQALLVASDGFSVSSPASGPLNIAINSSALVDYSIKGTFSDDILQGNEEVTCQIVVKNSSDVEVLNTDYTFKEGQLEIDKTFENILPDKYAVTVGPCDPNIFKADFDPTTPELDATTTIDLTLDANSTMDDCSKGVVFIVRTSVPLGAVAEVNKVTEPAGLEDGWTMTLQGPGLPAEGLSLVTSDNDAVTFERFQKDLADFLLQEGTYTITETLKEGWTQVSAVGDCQFTINYPADYGVVKKCEFTNRKLGTVIINKETLPDGDTATAFAFTDDISEPNTFDLMDDGTKTFLNIAPGKYTVAETDPHPDYDLSELVCTDDATQEGYNVLDSGVDVANLTATINLDAGETVECTFTNTKRGMAMVNKLTDGVANTSINWVFTLSGPGVNASDQTIPQSGPANTLLDFNNAKLIPGETYRLCEVDIPVSWTTVWTVGGVTIPEVLDNADPDLLSGENYSPVFNPNYVATGEADNSTLCVKFVVEPGQTLSFEVNNISPPGGDQRTIGYWKNWNTCSGGRQQYKAADNGFFLLEDALPLTIGSLVVSTCDVGRSLLDKRDIDSGKKRAGDPAYGLAAQLLAAKANVAVGAGTCAAVTNAITEADILLTDIGFEGKGDVLKKGNRQLRIQANDLASKLDDYNNGLLCP